MVHRDRQGNVVTVRKWADLWDDMDYRVVAEDDPHGVLVRTVWDGIDGIVGAMYATGISRDNGQTWANWREDARTEAEALVQHREVFEEILGEGTPSI